MAFDGWPSVWAAHPPRIFFGPWLFITTLSVLSTPGWFYSFCNEFLRGQTFRCFRTVSTRHFDGIFHKGEYFIRGYTFATSMDRGNPTLRSYAKKDQDRTNTPSNRTRNDRTKYPWNEDSSEDKKIERNAIHGSARGKRCHRSSTNQDTYFGRN